MSAVDASATPSGGRIVATVLVPFGFGYYLSYLYRTMNAVIAPQLAGDIGIGASGLGFLTSAYFISFAAVQLPIGILLDRFGPRRVQSVLLLIAALGGAVFAAGQSLAVLAIGRALIGIGVAGCFMALLKANALWWPVDRLPLVNGITAAFGSLGALFATLPLELALSVMDWRGIFLIVSALTVAVAGATFLTVPERPGHLSREQSLAAQASAIGGIYRDAAFWRPGCMIIAGFAAYMAYQTLWAGPWLRDIAGFDRLGVANRLLAIQIGMFVGVIVGGALADRIARSGPALARVIAIGVGLFLLAQLLLLLEFVAIAGILWAGFGFFGATLFLCYSLYAQQFPAQLLGRVNTANNVLLFGAAFAVQWGIGAVIGAWPTLDDGHYDPAGHRVALATVLVVETATWLYFVWPRVGGPGSAR